VEKELEKLRTLALLMLITSARNVEKMLQSDVPPAGHHIARRSVKAMIEPGIVWNVDSSP
jgi:hypothetical protein